MKLFMRNVILSRENKISDVSYGGLFNFLIKLNHKMLILSRLVRKMIVYVTMTTEWFIKIFLLYKVVLFVKM